MNFQDIINSLQNYWQEYGCVILQPYTSELGAATLHPATVMSALNDKPMKFAYCQPVIRPSDSRYGENPNRLYQHHQYQVIIKPSHCLLQEDYIKSLEILGISTRDNDIKFVEDNWENPSIGAWGLGWEVVCNGMEITQFTYMQQMGGIECPIIPGEIAYGLERLAMHIQDVDSVYDIVWNDSGVTYGDIFRAREYEFSAASLDCYDVNILFRQFSDAEQICKLFIERGLSWAGYDQCSKASHILNLLESRGVIGVNERAAYILRVRQLVKLCCESYMKSCSN